jgi:hypothetical protein
LGGPRNALAYLLKGRIMKRNLSAIAVGIALAYAAPAFATDTSNVNQTGSNNHATVQQSGNAAAASNTSNITQNGNGHTANVYQTGNNGVQVTISQTSGNNDTATVYQTSVTTGSVTINQLSDGNQSTINQHNGSNLTAEVNTSGYGGASGSYNTANMDQTGDHQFGRIEQSYGSGNLASITQAGSYDNGYITQYGLNNQAYINQNGGGVATNTAVIYQNGQSNYGATTQSGNGRNSTTNQTGNGNVANVSQT